MSKPRCYTLKSGRLPLDVRIGQWISKRFLDFSGSERVFRMPRKRILKKRCYPSEFEAMEFVRNNTNIPVPTVLKIYQVGEHQHLMMEAVDGEPLDFAWTDMPWEQKEDVIQQWAGYIAQLRALEPIKPGAICSATLGPGNDHRLGGVPMGPFETVSKFHDFVRQGVPLENWPSEDVRRVHARSDYKTKYTHADLNPSNILVNRGKIVAIVDWETAGWFPEYWEYTKMHFGWMPYRKEMYEMLDVVITPYPEELAAETAIWQVFDCLSYDPRCVRIYHERKE